MRALGIFLVGLVQGQNGFEGLMTIEANIIVKRAWTPPVEDGVERIVAPAEVVDC
jgi:hypothetical protein